MVYLDNAATSRKKPLSVIFALLVNTILSANAGRAGHKAGLKTSLKIEKTREILKRCFFDGNVIFTKNCTEALNLVICGLNPTGTVITTVYDHNSVLRPLRRLEREGKIKLKIVSPDENGFEKPITDALTLDTSLVIMSARSNVNGRSAFPEKVAKEIKAFSNAKFVLDVAQSAGHDKLSYENIDAICSAGHKGTLGPQGTGFLIFKKNLRINPLITGGTGTAGNSIEAPTEVPESLEAGTLNSAGIIALGKGAEYAFDNMNRLNKHIKRCVDYLKRKLSGVQGITLYPSDGGVVLCNIANEDSAQIADELSKKYGIYVRGGLHCAPLMHLYLKTSEQGAIRLSFGANNNLLHAAYAYYALKNIARKYRR